MEDSTLKQYVLFMAALFVYSSFVYAQSESELRERLVGTWKLVSTQHIMKDGTTRPYPQYGSNGKGFLMYTREGYMCADLVNADRPKWKDGDNPTTEEKVAAGGGTFAYCGRYEIDVKEHRLIHLPEVATDPGYVGSRQIRPYKFENGRMFLGDVSTLPGVSRWQIVWEKVK
jgi:hypothetical protein